MDAARWMANLTAIDCHDAGIRSFFRTGPFSAAASPGGATARACASSTAADCCAAGPLAVRVEAIPTVELKSTPSSLSLKDFAPSLGAVIGLIGARYGRVDKRKDE